MKDAYRNEEGEKWWGEWVKEIRASQNSAAQSGNEREKRGGIKRKRKRKFVFCGEASSLVVAREGEEDGIWRGIEGMARRRG